MVLDTNVLVSAFLVADGRSGEVIQRVIIGLDELFISPAILQELERVLISKLKMNEELCNSYVNLLTRRATIVVPNERLSVIESDKADNRILECRWMQGRIV
jgi:putative PIN family toxin of toxin-antitoxin system